MTPQEATEKLIALRGTHDQTARCEAIRIVVAVHYGDDRNKKEMSDTERFIELMIEQLGAGA
jgi:hypothetical protein